MNVTILILTILAIVVFVVIMLCITFVLYKRITKQDEPEDNSDLQLSKDLHSIRENIAGNDEIHDLISSFTSMESALLTQIENIAIMTAEREKVHAELNVATRIQRDALPDNFHIVTDTGKCDIYGSMKSAKEVGGDFYDFFMIDDNRLCIVIADVSGKGVPGALFMMVSKVLTKQRAKSGGKPSQILFDVNNQLCADNKEMLFVTAWLGIVDLTTGDVDYCNAGHEYPVILSEGKALLIDEDANDPPLALSEDFEFSDKHFKLAPGDGLFIYTDGVAEAKGSGSNRYGIDRMLKTLESSPLDASCRQVIGIMENDMDAFVENKEPFDDVTMLMIRLEKKTN